MHQDSDFDTISVTHNQVKVVISLPQPLLSKGGTLAQEFQEFLLSDRCKSPTSTQIELYALFIEFCKSQNDTIARVIFNDFEKSFAGNNDIHITCCEYGLTQKRMGSVLRTYYSMVDINISPSTNSSLQPAIFSNENVNLMALFGGQTGDENYFKELEYLYHAYHPLVSDFIFQMSSFIGSLIESSRFSSIYSNGLDFAKWLDNPDTTPSIDYMLISPVSIPMYCIIQLLQILITFKTLRMSPDRFVRSFKVVVGHSQGILPAVVLSLSEDDASFYAASKMALSMMVIISSVPQLWYPLHLLPHASTNTDLLDSSVPPRPALSVQGINKKCLEQFVTRYNKQYKSKYDMVYISVINTMKNFVISGKVGSVEKFAKFIRKECISSEENQSRVLYSQRKPVVTLSYLNITIPSHIDILAPVIDMQYKYTKDFGISFDPAKMQIPVRSSNDGHDIRNETDLVRYLLQSNMVLPVNWPVSTNCPGITHIVDFGPGGTKGFGFLAYQNMEGRGVSVICASTSVPGDLDFGTRVDLYKSDLSSVIKTPNWIEKYSPTLVCDSFDTFHISTKMSQLLGKPPIMVAGMTPTTSNVDIVSSVLNSGYHIELSCGGIHTRDELNSRVKNLVDMIKPGYGITFNCVYLNQSQWSFQFPAIVALRKKGIPIEGLCIGGGIPSVDVAFEIINTIQDAGLCHIAFKPGSVESIHEVVKIAKKSPRFPIMLQWTGGRGGGHHSSEDFHQPILDTYRTIRTQNNIVLVAGSGFGDADDIFPYLTGEWSTCFGHTPMPFDGILFGSRMMVAKESKAADSVKELIIAAQGVSDCDWEQTYAGPAGGVVTIKSEFDESMHVIANKCSLFWKELDDTLFSIPPKDRLSVLLDKKDYIVNQLNRNHTRPWFGITADGHVADIEEMTYIEVAIRLVDLLYIKKEARWIHPSHISILIAFLMRIEERFCSEIGSYVLNEVDVVGKPYEQVDILSNIYLDSTTQLVTSEDIHYFIKSCKRHGQKSVPFIPILDDNFESWFKKDMVFQSEDLLCVPNQDPQRVIILQGPVAVRYSTEINVPAKNILDNINKGLISKLLVSRYNNNMDDIRSAEYLIKKDSDVPSFESVYHFSNDESTFPDNDRWAAMLSVNNKSSWLYVLMMSPYILEGKKAITNNIRTMLRPRIGYVVYVATENNIPLSVNFEDSYGRPILRILSNSQKEIELFIYHHMKSGTEKLSVYLRYIPQTPFLPIQLDVSKNNNAIREFFDSVMKFGISECNWIMPYTTCHENSSISSDHLICSSRYMEYLISFGNAASFYNLSSDDRISVSADYLFVLAYPTIYDCISKYGYCADLTKIVHASNTVKIASCIAPLCIGDTISSRSTVCALENSESGKLMKIKSVIIRGNDIAAEIITAILTRNMYINISEAFSIVDEEPVRVYLEEHKDVAVLMAKDWFIIDSSIGDKLKSGSLLEFRLKSHYRFKSKTLYSSVSTAGTVLLVLNDGQVSSIGKVDYTELFVYTNSVMEYLSRHGHPVENYNHYLNSNNYISTVLCPENYFFTAPASNWNYSYSSGDYNPIHTNTLIAEYSGLPSVITHGMYTSAQTRAFIERHIANDVPSRIISYNVDFVGIVTPGEKLIPDFVHTGMKGGRMLIKGSTAKKNGDKVLEFTAEVEQPPTAYIFTGQGSQVVGMGMELYGSSSASRSVWDRGDRHFIEKYGVSICDIVKRNPVSYTVYFDGDKGSVIRNNYMELIPDVSESTRYHTFTSPKGLLHMTQFTQPALVLFEASSIADMNKKGLIQSSSLFAGHSLGEYAALCAIGNVFSLEDTLDIVFYRGLLMQQAIDRDVSGQSGYGMISVNPSCIGVNFREDDLMTVVKQISASRNELLEISNYNIDNLQYVVSGTIQQLKILSVVLNRLSQHIDYRSESVNDIIQRCMKQVADERAKSGNIALERGLSTIPLSDIDIPFHSSILSTIVNPLRQYIQRKIKYSHIDYSRLCCKYIPNLIGEPFDINREYLERVYNQTKSMPIETILDGWDFINQIGSAKQQQIMKILLVELLAFQVAYPVQWISTQNYLLTKTGTERIIEVGPASVLSNMAKKSASIISVDITALSISTNGDEIYYYGKDSMQVDGTNDILIEQKPEQQRVHPVPKDDLVQGQSQAQTSVLTSDHALTLSQPSQAENLVPDVPLDPLFIIKAIIAQKLKKPIPLIFGDNSISVLSGGKSTLQNEILGNLKREFGNSILGMSKELSLNELSSKMTSFTGKLGDHTLSQISRLFRTKCPGGFTQLVARNYLNSEYNLGPQRCDGILLQAITMEPTERLSNDIQAKEWIDIVVKEYADSNKLCIQRSVNSNTNSITASILSTADIQRLDKDRGLQKQLVTKLIETLSKYIDIDIHKDRRISDNNKKECYKLQCSLDEISDELGDAFIDGIKPIFDHQKSRRYNSYWNWVRQDSLSLFYSLLTGEIDLDDSSVTESIYMIKNRFSPVLVDMFSFWIKQLEKLSPEEMQKPVVMAVHNLCSELLDQVEISPVYIVTSVPTRPFTILTEDGTVEYHEIRSEKIKTLEEYIRGVRDYEGGLPLVHIQSCARNGEFIYDTTLTDAYMDSVKSVHTNGISYSGRRVLITGCGKGSIGEGVLQGMLRGGARVVATTSNYSPTTISRFEKIYRECGSRGSELVVVPFNQSSTADIKNLIRFIFDRNGLGWDLDIIIPFAALPKQIGDITSIDSQAELSIRTMLINVYRLLGEVAAHKASLNHSARIAQVIMPLSINHGHFGGDGLYGESKLGLRTLLNRWYSESWSTHLQITGAIIGWTRGTALMKDNNISASGIEKDGMYTFTAEEMAMFILCLSDGYFTSFQNNIEPIVADISGRVGSRKCIAEAQRTRNDVYEKSLVVNTVHNDISYSMSATIKMTRGQASQKYRRCPRANYKPKFPQTKSYEDLKSLHYLQGAIDLDKVVVVTGFGEVGPYGNSKTRWEMEAYGEFSLEGCIELAWVMGYTRFFSGVLGSTGKQYTGWIDIKTGNPIDDIDIKARYEKDILDHTGIRLIEPDLHDGYDPTKTSFMRELQIEHDMEPFETTKEEAEYFKIQHGDKVDIWESEISGTWIVRFLKSAVIMVPKALRFDRLVAGQIPYGWDPVRFGIPDDIVKNTDPTTCYVLVATIEALLRSGITDPYELYRYFHVSRVGNTVGSGIGGISSLTRMHSGRLTDQDIQKDILQETLINTVAAWTNMLLISSSGPIKPVVGACGTAVLSIDVAIETIQSDKADVVIAGGFDDFDSTSTFQFGQMGATSSSNEETMHGRAPSEMSRPCTTTRSGFMESEGSGIAILMSASAAIKAGAPIYGIIALSNTASDKIGRSVPAPGQGILTTAKEVPGIGDSVLFDFNYRRCQLEKGLKFVDQWEQEISVGTECSTSLLNAFVAEKAQAMRKAVQNVWNNEFWKQISSISPLRGSLAVWGLDVDDIGVVSFHGTSTVANDLNESDVFNSQFRHLGRTPGNLVPVITQKWLTGHPKGAAASWMLNGLLQVLDTGLIPGNRNADNIEEKLEQFEHLVYPSKSIQTSGIKAGLLKSFGFGQVGGELLVVHSDYVLATLSRDELEKYRMRVKEREGRVYRYWHNTFVGNHKFVQVKDEPPYTKEHEQSVYLDPEARVKYNNKRRKYTFDTD